MKFTECITIVSGCVTVALTAYFIFGLRFGAIMERDRYNEKLKHETCYTEQKYHYQTKVLTSDVDYCGGQTND